MFIAVSFYLLHVVVAVVGLVTLWRHQLLVAFSMLLYLSTLTLVRPAILYLGLDDPQPSNGFSYYFEDTTGATVVVAVWMVVFLMTVLFSRQYLMSFGQAIVARPPDFPSTPRIRLLAAFVILLGVSATFLMVLQVGGIGRFMFAVKVEKALSGGFILRHLAVLGVIFSFYGLFQELKNASSRRQKRSALWFYGSLIAVGLFTNFAWGNRGNIAYILVAAGIGWHFYISPLRPLKVLLLVAILFGSMKGLGEIRKGAIIAQSGVEFGSDNIYREVSRSLHFVEYDALALAVRDAGTLFDFRYGADFENGIKAMVPRFIMPDRETFHIGGWFRRIYQPTITNGWPVTVVGDWWINFGAFGILLGGMMSGFLAGALDGALKRPESSAWTAIMAPTLGILVFKGGVATGFPQQIIMTLIPLALFTLALHARFRTGPSTYRSRPAEA